MNVVDIKAKSSNGFAAAKAKAAATAKHPAVKTAAIVVGGTVAFGVAYGAAMALAQRTYDALS